MFSWVRDPESQIKAVKSGILSQSNEHATRSPFTFSLKLHLPTWGITASLLISDSIGAAFWAL